MYVIAIAAIAGSFTWLMGEYLIHRFLGHGKHTKRTQFGREHTKHHALGNYFAPWQVKARAALPVFVVFFGLSALIAGPLVGAVYVSSFGGTYLLYELLHRRAHTHPPTGRYTRWARRHHFYHHFGDPKVNHGVTTPIGDWLLFTNTVPAEKVRVPEKLVMDWLVDPNTGDVYAEHAEDYELVRLPHRRAKAEATEPVAAVGATAS